jgi:hypothetical protein
MRLAVLVLCVLLAGPVAAQSIRGIALGDPVPSGLSDPERTMVRAPYRHTLWTYDDGISMSVTTDIQGGIVVNLRMWRDGADVIAPTPVDGLVFGQSTLRDVIAAMGSEGFVYGRATSFMDVGDLRAHALRYEIAGTGRILTLGAIEPLDGASDETAGNAILDTLDVTEGAYLDAIWGNERTAQPGYAPIGDPVTRP